MLIDSCLMRLWDDYIYQTASQLSNEIINYNNCFYYIIKFTVRTGFIIIKVF